jgi:hypothetical protein
MDHVDVLPRDPKLRTDPVVFTIFTRILMIPLAINQQKGMIKMAKFPP